MSDWIQTFTGKKFYPLEPERNEYDIRDIAHALSLKCRFCGHCNLYYSVAEHSIRVASIVKPESKLWALLHDASEAYLPDICRPIKAKISAELPQRGLGSFSDLEAEHLIQIAKAFANYGLMYFPHTIYPPDVKMADTILLATEARDLMSKPPESWNLDVPVLPETIQPMSPTEAESLFLRHFELYTGKVETEAA